MSNLSGTPLDVLLCETLDLLAAGLLLYVAMLWIRQKDYEPMRWLGGATAGVACGLVGLEIWEMGL